MKQRLSGLAERYLTALRTHLQQGPRARLSSASKLGRQAVALGLETLQMARIHEQSLAKLPAENQKPNAAKQADGFFNLVITPIFEAHDAVRQRNLHLSSLKEVLHQRTTELQATQLRMKQGVARSKVVEAAFLRHGKRQKRGLEESLKLQQHLRQLTHRVLAVQESERTMISRELQDEIAQTLLGINVRLLSLKQQARVNSIGLKREIASTQRLVVASANSVRRLARDFSRT